MLYANDQLFCFSFVFQCSVTCGRGYQSRFIKCAEKVCFILSSVKYCKAVIPNDWISDLKCGSFPFTVLWMKTHCYRLHNRSLIQLRNSFRGCNGAQQLTLIFPLRRTRRGNTGSLLPRSATTFPGLQWIFRDRASWPSAPSAPPQRSTVGARTTTPIHLRPCLSLRLVQSGSHLHGLRSVDSTANLLHALHVIYSTCHHVSLCSTVHGDVWRGRAGQDCPVPAPREALS